MIRLRRAAASAVAVLLACVLAACGGLPTTGPVNAGQPIPEQEGGGNVVFLPDGPSKDATPQQIVEGFVAAGSGPRTNWETAKEFLAPDFRTQWNPRAGVTVYQPGERSLDQTSASEFTLSVTPVATVDAVGELSTWSDAKEISLSFTVAQQDDGQWRITRAPDGIVLDRNRFGSVYGDYALQFFDPTWTYLVPDERWFPRLYAATNIAEALIDGGPSPWLAQSVTTAFVDGARLAQAAVPVRSDKVAAVTLEEGARALGSETLNRMQTQLAASLATAGIEEVDMLVDEQTLTAQAVPVRPTRIYARPLVRTPDAFGFLSGSSIERIPGLSDAIPPTDPTDVEVSADRTRAAVRDRAGRALLVESDGETTTLDTRPGLLAPTIDPSGYVWSVPSDAPSALMAYAPDATALPIAGAWPGASQITAQRVSRDGTRLVAVVREGDAYALWAAGIQRDRTGAPTGLGERRVLGQLAGPARALAWLGASTVAVVTTADGEGVLTKQVVGGFGEVDRARPRIVAVAGSTQTGDIQLLDDSGELYGQRGSNWQSLASSISVLAVQQGSPG